MKISLQIRYEKKADKFLSGNKNKITQEETKKLIIKAVHKLTGKDENVDLVKMKGEFEGYFRIRKNDLRIIFSIYEDDNTMVVTVSNIDFRGSVYK